MTVGSRRIARKLSNEVEFSPRDRFMMIHKKEVDAFITLLREESIQLLIAKDKCCFYVDNYLLAMVLVFFKRASLQLSEYTEENFWQCLYLAHDMEEDEEELKWELLPWALGEEWRSLTSGFLIAKDKLWRRMDYRSTVTRRQCDQLMQWSQDSGIWNRFRPISHGGAVRKLDEEEYQPKGPTHFTPSFSALCTRCSDTKNVTDNIDSEDMLIVDDSLDTVKEGEENESDITLYDMDEDLNEIDSGLESNDDEYYRNFPIFA